MPVVLEVPATVKFFDPARGFGFVVLDTGGPEVFVHSSVLFRSGMTDLAPEQSFSRRQLARDVGRIRPG